MSKLITGIQQVGIGVDNVDSAKEFYQKEFGFSKELFRDLSVADLMKDYTGGEALERDANLLLNKNGGGGLECWSFTKRKPVSYNFTIGDTGINWVKLRSEREFSHNEGVWKKDSNDNLFELVPMDDMKTDDNATVGGVCGVGIGVSNLDASIAFYAKLGFKPRVGQQEKELFGEMYNSVRLFKDKSSIGAFANLFGPCEIELIQAINRIPNKIYKDRLWGDSGFIHLCFDVMNMDGLVSELSEYGIQMKVDSKEGYPMGKTSGRFTYAEDPDGTLLEFVEIHIIPLNTTPKLKLKLKGKKKPLSNRMMRLVFK